MSVQSGCGRFFLMLIGLLAFAGFTGYGIYSSWSRWDHSRKWTPTQARVEALELRCQVQVKRKKLNSDSESWQNEGPEKPCSEVENTARRTLLGQQRRIQRTEYATFAYQAGGTTMTRRMKRHDISPGAVVEGETVPIFVDPQNPARIDRSLAAMDLMFSGLFLLGGLFFLIATWFFPHLWRSTRRTRPTFNIRTS